MRWVRHKLGAVKCWFRGHQWKYHGVNLEHYDREEWWQCSCCGEEEDIYP